MKKAYVFVVTAINQIAYEKNRSSKAQKITDLNQGQTDQPTNSTPMKQKKNKINFQFAKTVI